MEKTKLGLLGLGSRTTAFYLSEINRFYNQEKGGYSTCPLLLLNTNFDTINSLLPSPSDALATIVQEYVEELEKMDIELLLIPNITLHETVDRLKIQTKIIHPLHLAVHKITLNNWTTVVLFGSLYSMQSDYIRTYFKVHGIEIVLPSITDRLLIDEVRKQVYSELETPELIKNYHFLIEKYSNKHPIVLACTELSILKPQNNHKLIDMVELQIIEAVKN